MNKAPNFEKKHLRASKGKRAASYPCSNAFFEIFKPINFLWFFEREDTSKCWAHKVFRLGLGFAVVRN